MAYTPQTTGELEDPQKYNINATGYSPEYGGVPHLPAYTTDTTTRAGTDKQAQMIANLPGYQGAVAQAMQNISAGQRGMVTNDVAANLGIRAAEFGAGAGLSLSPAAVTNFLSRYGLTSYQIQQDAEKNLLAQMAATPMQETETTQQKIDRSAEQAVFNAAPNPRAAADAKKAAAAAGLNTGLGAARTPTMPALSPQTPLAPIAGMGFNLPTLGGNEYNPEGAEQRWKDFVDSIGNTNELFAGEQGLDEYASIMQDPWAYLFGGGDEGAASTAFGYGNQPVSQGSMYVSPIDEWYTPEQPQTEGPAGPMELPDVWPSDEDWEAAGFF